MNLFLVNKHGRPAHDSDTKEFFGLDRKAKWPKEGMAPRSIQGIFCWVVPLDPDPTVRPRRGQWPSGPRALCRCPVCELVVPIGRLKQHAYFQHSKATRNVTQPPTINVNRLTNISMVAGGEKTITRVIHQGKVKEWVGIGWIEVRTATVEDLTVIPQAVYDNGRPA